MTIQTATVKYVGVHLRVVSQERKDAFAILQVPNDAGDAELIAISSEVAHVATINRGTSKSYSAAILHSASIWGVEPAGESNEIDGIVRRNPDGRLHLVKLNKSQLQNAINKGCDEKTRRVFVSLSGVEVVPKEGAKRIEAPADATDEEIQALAPTIAEHLKLFRDCPVKWETYNPIIDRIVACRLYARAIETPPNHYLKFRRTSKGKLTLKQSRK